MDDITVAALIAIALALCSDLVNARRRKDGNEKKEWLFAIAVILFLSLYGGLRTRFNDTGTYIKAYEGIAGFSSISDYDMSIGSNPGFFVLIAIFKLFTKDYHVFIFATTLFCVASVVLFFRKYSQYLSFPVALYIMTAAYLFSCAAIKQCLAMGLCLIATHFFIEKKWAMYLIFVLLAVLIHPYAVLYLLVPLIASKPWRTQTYAVLIGAAAVAFMLTQFMDLLLDLTNAIGEEFVEEDLSGEGVNVIRVIVYAIPTVLSFVFRKELYENSTPAENLITNLSVLSFALMFVGMFGTANMFARLANYFQYFYIISIPWILLRLKTKLREVYIYACLAGFAGFYYYSYYISVDFNASFDRITTIEFIKGLF
ncbi:MAG TPA: EpsG family protein [Bacillota bacterium]|nr:EpsG family protein [Bacillota bacterium]